MISDIYANHWHRRYHGTYGIQYRPTVPADRPVKNDRIYSSFQEKPNTYPKNLSRKIGHHVRTVKNQNNKWDHENWVVLIDCNRGISTVPKYGTGTVVGLP